MAAQTTKDSTAILLDSENHPELKENKVTIPEGIYNICFK
jgi:hypothetical protein